MMVAYHFVNFICIPSITDESACLSVTAVHLHGITENTPNPHPPPPTPQDKNFCDDKADVCIL